MSKKENVKYADDLREKKWVFFGFIKTESYFSV